MNAKNYAWSNFLIRVLMNDEKVIIKNTATGAVVRMNLSDEMCLSAMLNTSAEDLSEKFAMLASPNAGFLIVRGHDEYTVWRDRFVDRRNNDAHVFILHFLPTLQCQFSCGYCFENGGNRMKGMADNVIIRTRIWLEDYFRKHDEIDSFRLVFFGGEPLLHKDVMKKSLELFSSLANQHKLNFWIELTSNGEFLDEETACMLAKYHWRRVQITLDGPEEVHNTRRPGRSGRPTFQNVIRNIRMLCSTDYVEKLDIRISLDHANAERIPELIYYLASFDKQDRISLSLGFITPTMDQPERMRWDKERTLGEKAVAIWAIAKEHGFAIPEEFITGPWCVAIAKHSAILQPNGAFQKCFCTVGRAEYDFSSITDTPDGYMKDPRFEQWRRTDQCMKERCPFLPMCGGGCIHDAMVAAHGSSGGAKRFCQKSMLEVCNKGLLKLKY